MSGFTTCFAFVMCLLVVLTGSSSALSLWRPATPTYPSNPDDRFYQAFRTIPSHSVTADKLLKNFLHINVPQNIIAKRSVEIHDNVVVMDGSGSVGPCEFEKGKKAAKFIMEMDDPATVDARFAAVTFSSSATVNFRFIKPSSAVNEIMKIPYPGGSTNTQAGLAEAKKLFDDPFSGRRSSSKEYVLLVTDGKSNVQPSLTEIKAKALKRAGVEIHVVAVGNYYMSGIDEMVRMASYRPGYPLTPENISIYRVEDYNGFFTVAQLMLKKSNFGKWLITNGKYDPPC